MPRLKNIGMNKKKSLFRRAWKGFWSPILKCGLTQWIVASVFAACIWLVYFTCRVEFVNIETFKKYRRKPAIFAFWHGRSMMLSPIVCLRGMRSYAVASRHSDGRIMAKLQRLFGLKSIYGSTSDGGLSVLLSGVRILRRGDYSMCISPDGPGGPSLRVQDGILYFAKMTGAPIIPVCYSASHSWLQKRWDRYLVVLPFSRIVCYVGKPIFINSKISDAEFGAMRKKVENYMVKQMRAVDAKFNLPRVEQDMTATEYKKNMRAARQERRKQK